MSKKEVITKDVCNEMTDAQREAIVYRSKLLNKYYESYEDMLKDEAEYKRQNEEKLKLAEERKADAKAIEEARLKAIQTRKDAAEMIRKAEEEYNKLLNDFVKKYGSYHVTYYDGFGNPVSDLIKTFFNW